MLPIFHSVLCSFRVWFRNHAKVQLEVIALRHQLVVIYRQNPKPKLRTADRCLWVWLSRIWSDWRSTLLIVKPETGIAAAFAGTGPGRFAMETSDDHAFRRRHEN